MHLLHEITSFGASLQPCSHVAWGRQHQDPGEPGRCRVGSASSGSPAPGQWGCSACSALVVSEGPQHPLEGLGWAAPPHCCIPGLPAEGGCIGRIWEGTMRSGAVWSGPAPEAGSWTSPAAQAPCRESGLIPSVGVCSLVSGSSADLWQPNRDRNENQPTILDSA